MAVFHKLCRRARSSRAHKTESLSVMGHTRSAERNIIVHISLFWSDVLPDRHVLLSEDDFG